MGKGWKGAWDEKGRERMCKMGREGIEEERGKEGRREGRVLPAHSLVCLFVVDLRDFF